MAKYQLKYPFSEYACLPCAVLGETLDLTGKGYEKTVPATVKMPEHKVRVRGASQQDLKRLFEDPATGNWSHLIEKVEDTGKKEESK